MVCVFFLSHNEVEFLNPELGAEARARVSRPFLCLSSPGTESPAYTCFSGPWCPKETLRQLPPWPWMVYGVSRPQSLPSGGLWPSGLGKDLAFAPGPSRDAPRRLWAQVRSRSPSAWGLTLSSWEMNEDHPPGKWTLQSCWRRVGHRCSVVAQLGRAGQAGDGAGPGTDAASACPRGGVTRSRCPTWWVRLRVCISLLGSELDTGSAVRKWLLILASGSRCLRGCCLATWHGCCGHGSGFIDGLDIRYVCLVSCRR